MLLGHAHWPWVESDLALLGHLRFLCCHFSCMRLRCPQPHCWRSVNEHATTFYIVECKRPLLTLLFNNTWHPYSCFLTPVHNFITNCVFDYLRLSLGSLCILAECFFSLLLLY